MVSIFEVFDADAPELRKSKLVTKTKFEQALLLFNQKKCQEAEQLCSECLCFNPRD